MNKYRKAFEDIKELVIHNQFNLMMVKNYSDYQNDLDKLERIVEMYEQSRLPIMKIERKPYEQVSGSL